MIRRAAVLAAAALLLTACDSSAPVAPASEPTAGTVVPGSGSHGEISLIDVPLPDGRVVLCVSERDYSASGLGMGLSCDWAGSRLTGMSPGELHPTTKTPHPKDRL